MDIPDADPTFTIGITSLKELAEQKGWRYEKSDTEERVIRPDGTDAVRVPRKLSATPLYSGVPTVWMRSIRWHTYNGKPQPEGALYLAHEDQVENIEAVLKFAVREAPPLKAKREPISLEPAIAESVPAPVAVEPPSPPPKPAAAESIPPPKTIIPPPVKAVARSAPAKVMTTRDMPTKKKKK